MKVQIVKEISFEFKRHCISAVSGFNKIEVKYNGYVYDIYEDGYISYKERFSFNIIFQNGKKLPIYHMKYSKGDTEEIVVSKVLSKLKELAAQH